MKYKIVINEYQSIEYEDIEKATTAYEAVYHYHCFLRLSGLIKFVCGETVWKEFNNG